MMNVSEVFENPFQSGTVNTRKITCYFWHEIKNDGKKVAGGAMPLLRETGV
ncbi:MAG: hypothetical protein LBT55_07385 [Clostridiaceae bacterium]|jgi:hypothetical protein|nr:hypothetical protein [Clostridiaceae bacterium]